MYLHVSIMKLFTMLASFFYTKIHIYYLFLFVCLFVLYTMLIQLMNYSYSEKNNEMGMLFSIIAAPIYIPNNNV